MSSLIVRGVSIEEFTGYCSKSGQMTYEFTCRAAWSDVVCRELGWTEEPVGFGNGNLEGKLHGVNLIMEPSDKKLRDYRFDVPISTVGSFKHRCKIEDGVVSNRELEFVVTTVAEDAASALNEYLKHCGPAGDRAQVKINFSAEEQTTLGEGGQPAEDKPRGRKKEKAEAAV